MPEFTLALRQLHHSKGHDLDIGEAGQFVHYEQPDEAKAEMLAFFGRMLS